MPALGDGIAPFVAHTAIISRKGCADHRDMRCLGRGKRRGTQYRPFTFRRLPLQNQGPPLFLVFEVIQPDRVGPSPQKINPCGSLTDGLARADPGIDKGGLTFSSTIIPAVPIAFLQFGV